MLNLLELRRAVPRTAQMALPQPVPAGKYRDAGVVFVRESLPLIRVQSSPASGQYAFSEETGVYTFSVADAGRRIKASALASSPKERQLRPSEEGANEARKPFEEQQDCPYPPGPEHDAWEEGYSDATEGMIAYQLAD